MNIIKKIINYIKTLFMAKKNKDQRPGNSGNAPGRNKDKNKPVDPITPVGNPVPDPDPIFTPLPDEPAAPQKGGAPPEAPKPQPINYPAPVIEVDDFIDGLSINPYGELAFTDYEYQTKDESGKWSESKPRTDKVNYLGDIDLPIGAYRERVRPDIAEEVYNTSAWGYNTQALTKRPVVVQPPKPVEPKPAPVETGEYIEGILYLNGTKRDDGSIETHGIDFGRLRTYNCRPELEAIKSMFNGELKEQKAITYTIIVPTEPAKLVFPFLQIEEFQLSQLRLYDYYGKINTGAETTFHAVYFDDAIEGGIDWNEKLLASFNGQKDLSWQEEKFTDKRFIYQIIIRSWGVVPSEVQFYGKRRKVTLPPMPEYGYPIDYHLRDGRYMWSWNAPSGRGNDLEKLKINEYSTGSRCFLDHMHISSKPGELSDSPAVSGGWNMEKIVQHEFEQGNMLMICFKCVSGYMIPLMNYKSNKKGENSWLGWIARDKPVKPTTGNTGVGSAYFTELKKFFDEVQAERMKDTAGQWAIDVMVWLVKKYKGRIKIIDTDNEIDRSWLDVEANTDPKAWARFMVRLAAALKKVDPDIMISPCGFASDKASYILEMRDEWHRMKLFKRDASGKLVVNQFGMVEVDCPVDVSQIHGYSNSGGAQYAGGTCGLPPELSNMNINIPNYTRNLQLFAPPINKHIMGEVGFGMNEGKQQALATNYADGTPAYTKEQNHGHWIFATAMENSRHQFFMTCIYQRADETGWKFLQAEGWKPDYGTYSAMGMVQETQTYTGLINGVKQYKYSNGRRRIAADMFYQAKKYFRGYVIKEVLSENPRVYRLEKDGKPAWYVRGLEEKVLDAKGVVISVISTRTDISINIGAPVAKIHNFVDGSESMKIDNVNTLNGVLKLTAECRPVFITT